MTAIAKYVPANGARISAEDAAKFGKRLAQLENKFGKITPALVLDDARDPRSPLHAWFEWDDAKAAEHYRVERAGDLIRSIRIVVRTSTDERATPRAFVLVRPGDRKDPGSGEYLSIGKVALDEALSAELLRRMRGDFVAMQHRYEQTFGAVQKLRPISDALTLGIEIVGQLLADPASE